MKQFTLLVFLAFATFSLAFASNAPLIAFASNNFNGDRIHIDREWSASAYDGWNNVINSVIVPRGFEAHLYERYGYAGEYTNVRGRWSCAPGSYWFNRISSIRLVPIRHAYDPLPPEYGDRHSSEHRCGPRCACGRYTPPPVVTIFEHGGFQGAALDIRGEWTARQSCDFWNDRISSIYIPPGYGVLVYEHSYFRGASTMLTNNWQARRARSFWNDRISSLRVVRL